MTWFYNLKTSAKLMLGFSLIALAVATSGYIGLSGLEKTNDMLGRMYGTHLVGLSKISEAHVWQLHAVRAVRGALLAPTREDSERAAAEIELDFQRLREALNAAEPTLIRAEGKAFLGTIRGILPEWERLILATKDLHLAGKRQESLDAMKQARINGDKLQTAFEGVTALKLRIGEEDYQASRSLYASSRATVIGVSVLAIAAGLLMGAFLGRLIGGAMSRAVRVLEAVAGRDFTQTLEVSSTDEVGQMANALNQAVGGVQQALVEVRDVAAAVATASMQLSSSAGHIASGAQEQAASLEETASSLEEITATVKHSADNAQQASLLGSGARESAERGGAVVGEAVGAMGEINQSSKRIADIISTIDEIAFQTNLLALNAAVEAARAGEQGRGFAVVAAEVRILAQRSASSAKEIKGLIQDSVRKVEGGSQLVTHSGETLQEIVASVKRVTDLVAEMASASREQSAGIEQVNKAVAQMDQVTQSNAAQTEELSSTAESMSRQAEQLRVLVSQFRLSNDDSHRPAAQSA